MNTVVIEEAVKHKGKRRSERSVIIRRVFVYEGPVVAVVVPYCKVKTVYS